MTTDKKHHYIVEHSWRALRAFFALLGMGIWLWTCPGNEGWVFLCGLMVAIVDQFHGFICNRIERILHWKEDFDDWG